MAAKTQVQDMAIFITGIDMSSAFNTIYKNELFKIIEEFLDEDDLQILCTLLAETTLEVKAENAQATTFEPHIGSPQRDGIIGPLFTLYFNRALQQIKDEKQKEPIDCRDINPRWVEKMDGSIPEEIVCWWLWHYLRNRKGKGQDLWESKRNNEKQKPVSERQDKRK